MKKNTKILSNDYLLPLSYLFFGIILLLVDTLGVLFFVRSGLSFVMTPVAYEAIEIGNAGREYLETFIRLGDFREEYNELSISVYEKEVENSFYAILKEENESLKKQINLGNTDQNYIMSKVLSNDDYNFIRINNGESSGIAIGDVTVLGNTFVGIVTKVDKEGSLVRLPTSKGNSFEVIVVRGNVEEVRNSENITILSKGVVEGSSDGIRIENMSMSVDLKDGDIVVTNDSKVGEYLVLGYLVELSENPANTSRSGYVSPVMEYDRLMTVFVKTNF